MTEQSKDQIHQAEDKLNLSIGIECIKPAPDEIKNTKDVQPEIDEVKHEVPTEKNEGVSIIITATILGGILGFAGSYLFFMNKISAIETELTLRPPIAVVDFVEIASRYPDGTSKTEAEQLMVKTQKAIVKLSDAGYMVIDRSHLISAPKDLFLPPETIINDDFQYEGASSKKSN
mgnify:CR=1 FL=1|jgi:hypothetical protein